MPVDAYGVGSSLIRGENDFTADIVVTDGDADARRSGAVGSGRTSAARAWSTYEARHVLWDVDTQVDFVLPDGKLSVPGADEVVPGDGAARRLGARERRRARRLGRRPRAHRSRDLGRPRLREHVSRRTASAARAAPQRIPETRAGRPAAALARRLPAGRSSRELVAGRREILLLKKSFDVFTNPNTEAVLDALDPAEVILFGVATDVCDHAAIVGLLRRGRRVAFVEDAARGLDEERTRRASAHWRDAGVRFTTTDEVARASLS